MHGLRLEERFRIMAPERSGPVPVHRPELGPCRPWTGKVHGRGYAYMQVDGKSVPAHRVAYEFFVGPIPGGLEPDHLCHDPDVCQLGEACPHRSCVEVTHLELVTRRENVRRSGAPAGLRARQTHCKNDHEFTEENTIVCNGGRSRRCRICKTDYDREYHRGS